MSEVVPERLPKFVSTISALKKLCPGAKTLLDVGAATGDLVKIARGEGYEAEGIELSEYAIRMAREINSIEIEHSILAEVKKDGFYDCIHLNHVFEHFNEPLDELRHVHRLLNNNGLLYMEIPYQFHFIDKLLFKLKGSRSDFTLRSLHHAYFYTPRTISRLLISNGFEIIGISVFDAQRYAADTIKRKIKKTLWWMLATISIGNYIELYARKT